MENSMVAPPKIKNGITICSSNLTPGYKPQKSWKQGFKHIFVHHSQSTIIHNSRKVEAPQVSTDGWKGKQKVVRTYNGEKGKWAIIAQWVPSFTLQDEKSSGDGWQW